jgi:hypothetical protein
MLVAPGRFAGIAALLIALVGCGPRAAISLTAPDASSPTPDCSPRSGAVITAVRTVVASGTVAVALAGQAGTGAAQAPTAVPRGQLVAEAVATATAVARIPTPTPLPTSTPTAPPACPTVFSRPTTAAVAPAPTTQPAPAPTARANPPVVPPTPSPAAATLMSPTVLLASDSGSRVELHVGERFVLLLGQYTGMDWQVQLSDPSVLQRVGSDGQGVYEAAIAGQTELTAMGDPGCRRVRPACGAPSRFVRFVVGVQ